MTKKRILFISNDARRAGAQLLLIGFLRWLKERDTTICFDILLADGGELEPDLQDLGTVYRWDKSIPLPFCDSIFKTISNRILLRKLAVAKYDLIYSNTIINGWLLHQLCHLKIPILTHVHELDYWIKRAGKPNLEWVKKQTNHYIAASQAVKSNLITKGIFEKNISVVYEFTDCKNYSLNTSKSLRDKLGLPPEALIIGASGAEVFRKGKDLFVPLASHVLHRTKIPVHFVWIGGAFTDEIKLDLKNFNFPNQVHFVNHLANASDYFNEFYVFAMLSRDDPFPVVNLESGLRGVPVICFENSGGTPELIEEDIDSIVPYMDLAAFGDRLLWFINNSPERDRIGQKLSQRIQEKYDLNVIAPKILDIINTLD